MAKKFKSLKRKNILKSFRELEGVVKLKCFDCMGGQKKTDCELKDCSLYSFRPWADK